MMKIFNFFFFNLLVCLDAVTMLSIILLRHLGLSKAYVHHRYLQRLLVRYKEYQVCMSRITRQPTGKQNPLRNLLLGLWCKHGFR